MLTARLSGDRLKPLTPGGYADLARWLRDKGQRPADLVRDDAVVGAMEFLESGIDPAQVRELLRREVGRAMERNKLIYGLSTVTIIAQSDTKGGTWEGAQENHRYRWVPAAVFLSEQPATGNAALLRSGLPGVETSIIAEAAGLRRFVEGLHLGERAQPNDLFALAGTAAAGSAEVPVADPSSVARAFVLEPEPAVAAPPGSEAPDDPAPADADAGLRTLLTALERAPMSVVEIATLLGLSKHRAGTLVDRAIAQGLAIRPKRGAKLELAQLRLI